jgi:hypothetical protein
MYYYIILYILKVNIVILTLQNKYCYIIFYKYISLYFIIKYKNYIIDNFLLHINISSNHETLNALESLFAFRQL